MNDQIFDTHINIPISYNNMAKINPFNHKKVLNINNNIPLKPRFQIPSTTREFGREINYISNLTTHNNQEVFNSHKSLCFPIDKSKKDNHSSKIKDDQPLVVKKRKKETFSSLYNRKTLSNLRYYSNKNLREKIHNNNKSKAKPIQNKNIFNSNINIANNEDVVMHDENNNPNILPTTNRLISIDNIKNNNNDDFEMKPVNAEIKTKENIQNVDDYFDEICGEIFQNEEKYLVNPSYMLNQSDINQRMRAILIDWLIDVHKKYKLVPQTMYIAVNLIDRYLAKNETNRKTLQLVGITAMFIACKYEEIYPPPLKDFVYITDGAYVKSDVISMENKMLKSLDFDLTFPTQWSIFEIYKKKLDLSDKTFKLAWFLLELCLINYNSLQFKMSHLVASAILIASKTLGEYKSNWFGEIIGIEENKLEKCCKEIIDFNIYNSTHKLQAIRNKFSSLKYGEVAKIKIC